MSELLFEKWTGIDRHSEPSDMPITSLVELKNLSLTEEVGQLVKVGAWTDRFPSAYPSIWPSTNDANNGVKNIFQWKISQPVSKEILIFHVLISSRHTIWEYPYYDEDTSAFVNDFREITEAEGPYTIASSTQKTITLDGSQLLKSATADYYNTWFVNYEGQNSSGTGFDASFKISDYASNVLTSSENLGHTSDPVDDTVSVRLSRHPLMADLGSIIFLTVDSKIRFLQRGESLIIMVGNGDNFATQYCLIYQYITGTTNFSGRDLDRFVLDIETTQLEPHNDTLGTFTVPGGSPSLDGGAYDFKVAMILRGGQIGLESKISQGISATNVQVVNGSIVFPTLCNYYDTNDEFVSLYVNVFDSSPSKFAVPLGYNRNAMNDRIESIRVYVRTPAISAVTPDDFIFWKDFPVIDETASISWSEDEGINFINFIFDSDEEDIVDARTGQTWLVDQGGSTPVIPTFEKAVAIDERMIVTSVFNKVNTLGSETVESDGILMYSLIDGAGVTAFDSFAAKNIINAARNGMRSIEHISVFGDESLDQSLRRRILLWGENQIFILQAITGSAPDFSLDNAISTGLKAKDSVVQVEKIAAYLGPDGLRAFDGTNSQIIAQGLKKEIENLTIKSDCVGVFYERKKQIVFFFPTEAKCYVIELQIDTSSVYEITGTNFISAIPTLENGVIVTDGVTVFDFDIGTTQNTVDIAPEMKTLICNASNFQPPGTKEDIINLQRCFIQYESNTPILIEFFLDRSVTALVLNNVSPPSGLVNYPFTFPIGTTCKEFQIKVTIPSASQATNTLFKINRIHITAGITSNILN